MHLIALPMTGQEFVAGLLWGVVGLAVGVVLLFILNVNRP